MEGFGGQQQNQMANLGGLGVHSPFSASCVTGAVCQDPVLWDLEPSVLTEIATIEPAFIIKNAPLCRNLVVQEY